MKLKIKAILFISLIILIIFLMFLVLKFGTVSGNNIKIETDETCNNFGLNFKERTNDLNNQVEFCTQECNDLNRNYLGSKCNFGKEKIKCYCG